jgi:N-methylhydantoinase A
MHACKIAEEVGSTVVIVPRAASVFCALGMLECDIRLGSLKTYHGLIPGIELADFNAVIAETEKKALAELLQEGVERGRASLVRHLDMRYVGQHHEVSVEIPSACLIEEKHLSLIAEAFHRAHEKLYTYSTPENSLEIMNLRVTAVGAVDKTGLYEKPLGSSDPGKARKGKRKAHFAELGGLVEVPVYNRDLLAPGNAIPGPAIIEERITTIVVQPGWDARVDGFENVVMEARA